MKNPYERLRNGETILDLEIEAYKQESIRKQLTPGTLEYKLRKQYKGFTITQFLNHIAKK